MRKIEEDLGLLQAAAEIHDYSLGDLQHMLRVATASGVSCDMAEEAVLRHLGETLGYCQANVLLGHAQHILDYYDIIAQDGYDLADAIQDFIDGKC
jgi:hypothetical protein